MERDIFQTAETRSGFNLANIVKIISNMSLTSSVTPREKAIRSLELHAVCDNQKTSPDDALKETVP